VATAVDRLTLVRVDTGDEGLLLSLRDPTQPVADAVG